VEYNGTIVEKDTSVIMTQWVKAKDIYLLLYSIALRTLSLSPGNKKKSTIVGYSTLNQIRQQFLFKFVYLFFKIDL